MDTAQQRMLFAFLVCMCFVLLYAVTPSAGGQFFGLNTNATLTTSPQTPLPYSIVEVSLNAYAMDTTGAAIQWFVDDVEQKESINKRSIEVLTGDLGEKMNVRAVVSPLHGAPETVSLTIVPVLIDLIIEADTNVPSFYRGRALPAPGALIRIIAIPHDGSGASASAYTYEWKLNNKTLSRGPVKGDPVIEIEVPTFGDSLLVVVIYDNNGSVVGRKSIKLPRSMPELLFYEKNPLRGLSNRAVGNSYALIGDEVTVRAEPYFINKNIDAEENVYEWRVDGSLVQNTNEDPLEVTLRKTGGAGNVDISFRAANTKDFLQYVIGSFTIFFE